MNVLFIYYSVYYLFIKFQSYPADSCIHKNIQHRHKMKGFIRWAFLFTGAGALKRIPEYRVS